MSECIIQLANIKKEDVEKLTEAIANVLPEAIVTSTSVGFAITPSGCLVASLSGDKIYPGIQIDLIDNNSESGVVALVEQPVDAELRTLAYRNDSEEPWVTRFNIVKTKRKELDILIKDIDGTIGYAVITPVEGLQFKADLFVNKLNTSIIDKEDAGDWELYCSASRGKKFASILDTQLDAINSIREFWELTALEEMPEIETPPTLVEAVKYFRKSKEMFMVCNLYGGTYDKEV